MCCESGHEFWQLENVAARAFSIPNGDRVATDPQMQCRCLGTNPTEEYSCRCILELTQEDLKCNTCRDNCKQVQLWKVGDDGTVYA